MKQFWDQKGSSAHGKTMGFGWVRVRLGDINFQAQREEMAETRFKLVKVISKQVSTWESGRLNTA